MILRQILKTNEALRNDGIVYTDKAEQEAESKVLEAIVNTAKPLSEAVKPLKEQTKVKSSPIRKQASEVNLKEFLQRMRRKRAVQTIDQIFADFEALAGDYLFQSDGQSNDRRKFKEKFSKQYRSACCRLNVFIALNFVSGELYIKLLLKRIEWHKKALVANLDGVKPVYLERDISQQDLPISYQYYTFMFNHIQEYFPNNRKLFFFMQKKIAKVLYVPSIYEKIINKINN